LTADVVLGAQSLDQPRDGGVHCGENSATPVAGATCGWRHGRAGGQRFRIVCAILECRKKVQGAGNPSTWPAVPTDAICPVYHRPLPQSRLHAGTKEEPDMRSRVLVALVAVVAIQAVGCGPVVPVLR